MTCVGLDLRHDDPAAALDAAGHDPTAPSLFVCEDIAAHLSLEATALLTGALRSRAPAGSALVAGFTVAPEPGAPARAVCATTGALRERSVSPVATSSVPATPRS